LARTLADKTGGSREKALSGIERGWFFQPVPDSEKGSTCAKGEALSECARMARDELMRSVERFQREHPGSLVEKVVLSGRGARWKGLATAIAVQSTIPLSVAQDFALPFDVSGVEKSEIPEVASAACLGVIARKRARGCWNFRKKEMAGTSQARGWRRFALDIGVGIGIVLLCAVISLSFHIWLNNLELREVQDRTGPVLKDTVSGASSSLRPAHYLSVIQERINALREEVEHSSSSERGSDLAEFLLSFGNSPSKGEKALEKGTHWVRKREKERMNRLVHE
jgi:hypothetical protein